MTKVCIVDKCPNKVKYGDYFDFDFDVKHLSEEVLSKVLKKDVTLDLTELEEYDYIILVGSEAAKMVAKLTSVTNHAGVLIDGKYLCMINPAMLIFKPEGQADFDRTVAKIKGYISGEVTDAKIQGEYIGIDTELELEKYIDFLEGENISKLALDCETSALYPRDGHVLGISISHKELQGVYILTDIISEEVSDRLQKIFLRSKVIFHNMKFDYKWLNYHFGWVFDDVEDTMCLHYVLDERQGTHGLKNLAIKFTNFGDYDKPLEEFKKDYIKRYKIKSEDFSYAFIPFDIMYPYASMDTAVTLQLFNKFIKIVENNPKLNKVYNKLMIPGTEFLMNVEETGIPINSNKLKAAGVYLKEIIDKNKKDLYSFDEIHALEKDQRGIFNPNSVPQLRKLLFDYLGLTPTGKLTGTGAISTDAEVLQELSEEHPIPKILLEMRRLSKIKNTYVDKILPQLDRDGRIRTNFNNTFTTSGRLSSSGKFNAQQIVRDDPIIKGCIEAPEGYTIVSQDLTTAEMYIAAVLSKDKNLMKVFQDEGGDFHGAIAKQVFKLKVPVEEVKKAYPIDRQAAKAVSFGILFGSGPTKVADTVNSEGGNMSVTEAKDVIKQYFDTFSNLKRWLDSRKEFIEQNGYTYSALGRKRRLGNYKSKDKGIVAHEVRSGINMEIQSVASDINVLAAIETQDYCNTNNIDAKIFMLVHDSIVALVKDEHVEEYCKILKKFTQKDRGFSIPGAPIGVDQEIGKDYSFGKFDNVYRFSENKLSRISA